MPLFSEDFLSPAFDFRHRAGAGKCKKEQSICFQFDLVAWLFGGQGAVLSRIIYTLVGIAAVWCISLLFRDNDLIEK